VDPKAISPDVANYRYESLKCYISRQRDYYISNTLVLYSTVLYVSAFDVRLTEHGDEFS